MRKVNGWVLVLCMFILVSSIGVVSAKNFNITSNGNQLFFVNGSSGNIGVGTGSPSDTFDVLYNTSEGDRHFKTYNSKGVRLQRTGDTSGWAYEYGFLTNTGLDSGGFGGYGTNSALNYYYIGENYTNAKMVIEAGGDVGIGDSTPDYKLDVAGTFRADSAASFGSTITSTGDVTTSGGDNGFYNVGTADWYMFDLGTRSASSGRYGIGLTNDEANRQLSFHVPNQAAYGSTGVIPSFTWRSNGAIELMNLTSDAGDLSVKGSVASDGLTSTGNIKTSGDVWSTDYCDESGANCKDIINLPSVGGSPADEYLLNLESDDLSIGEIAAAMGTSSSGMTKCDDSTAPAPGCFETTGARSFTGSRYWKIDVGSEYIFETWVKVEDGAGDTATYFYAGWEMYNGSKTSYGNNQRYWGSNGEQFDEDTRNDGEWYLVRGKISGVGASTGNFISGTEYARFLLLMNYLGQSTSKVRYAGMKLYKSRNTISSLYVMNTARVVDNDDSSRKLVVDSSGNMYPADLTVSGDINANDGDLFVNSTSGYVGIGTSSPGYKLSVENELSVFSSGDTSDPKTEGHLLRVVDTTNGNPDIDHFFVENDLLTYGARWHYDGGDNLFQLFMHNNNVDGTEVLRFNRDNTDVYIPGNVGIGMTPGVTLDVSGYINASGDICLNDGTCLGNTASADSYVPYTGATGSVDLNGKNLTNVSYLGINVTDPTTPLQLANDGWISAKNAAGDGVVNMFKVNSENQIEVGAALNIGSFEFSADSGLVTFVDMPVTSDAEIGSPEGYAFKIDRDNIMTVYAESDGAGGVQNKRVGIGTVTPENALNVVGDANFTGSVYAGGLTMTGNVVMADNKITGLADGSADADAVTYSQLQAVNGTIGGGDVTGVSGGTAITVTNEDGPIPSVAVTADSIDGTQLKDTITLDATLAITQANYDVNFDANTLFVDGSANRVGIGKTGPDASLDVEGNAYIGSSGVNYNVSSTLRLDGLDYTMIQFHDSGSTIGNIKFSHNYGFEIGADDGTYGTHNTIMHGDVGIGTVEPVGNLNVIGTGNFTGALTVATLDTGQGANELYGRAVDLVAGSGLSGGGDNTLYGPDGDVDLSLGTLTADWDAGGYEIRAKTFESDQATGTAPLIVASTTKVANLNADLLDGYQLSEIISTHSGSDFTDGTLVRTSISATAAIGDSFVIEISGKSYSSTNPPFKVIAQGYLYNSGIINTAGISYGGNFASSIYIFEDDGDLCFWWPRIGYWQSFSVHVRKAGGDSYNRVTSISNSAQIESTKNATVTLKTAWNNYNDGSGSSLDADLLDGYNSSDFILDGELGGAETDPLWTGNESNVAFINKANTFGAYNQNFDSGTLFINATRNNVGIGTTTPDEDARLYVSTSTPTVNTETRYAGYFKTTMSGSANTYGYGVVGIAEKTGGFGYAARGVVGIGKYDGTPASGITTSLFGVAGQIEIDGSTTAMPVPNAYALHSSGVVNGNITSYYGLYVDAPTGTGTITNQYGAYFEDNVGIGTTNPDAKLEVIGNAIIGAEGTGLVISSDGYLSDEDDDVHLSDKLDMDNHAIIDIDWANSDDGSGTGLDADLLDGLHASTFYNASNPAGYITAGGATDVWVNSSGDTMTGDLRLDKTTPTIFFDAAGTGDVAIRGNGENLEIYEPEDSNTVWARFTDDTSFQLIGTPNLIVDGNGTFGGDVTVSGGDLSITNNNGGINFNDASKYWMKTATNWGIYWDTSANSIGFRGSGTERGSIDLDNGNLQMDGTGTFGSYIQMQESNFINRRFEMLENFSPQYILLCINGANNDVNGRIQVDRTSGNYQSAIVDVIVSSGTSAMYGGALRTLQVLQSSERYQLVTVNYSGSSYVAVKYTGNTYPETTGAYFTGRIVSTNASNIFTVVNSTSISNEASFGGTSKADFDVDTLMVNNNLVWHAGNDGAGTGLDADKLDGYNSSDFVLDSELGGSESDPLWTGNFTNIAFINKANSFGAYNQSFDSGVLFVDATGNRVGIGTSNPIGKLDIRGTTYFENGNIDGTYGDQVFFGAAGLGYASTYLHKIRTSHSGNTANGGMIFSLSDGTTTGYNDVLTLKENGKVGIGTTAPSKKLEVNGTAGGLTFDVDDASSGPTINTTAGNVTITSMSGSVIIKLG